MAGPEKRGAIQDLLLELFQLQVNHRSDVESDELGDEEPSHDDETQRPTRRAVGAITQSDRQRAKDRGERRHDDRAKTVHARVMDGLLASSPRSTRWRAKSTIMI